jgi:hypothetical protein
MQELLRTQRMAAMRRATGLPAMETKMLATRRPGTTERNDSALGPRDVLVENVGGEVGQNPVCYA